MRSDEKTWHFSPKRPAQPARSRGRFRRPGKAPPAPREAPPTVFRPACERAPLRSQSGNGVRANGVPGQAVKTRSLIVGLRAWAMPPTSARAAERGARGQWTRRCAPLRRDLPNRRQTTRLVARCRAREGSPQGRRGRSRFGQQYRRGPALPVLEAGHWSGRIVSVADDDVVHADVWSSGRCTLSSSITSAMRGSCIKNAGTSRSASGLRRRESRSRSARVGS